MLKIALIPIDNRPICYDFISDGLKINSDIKLFMPDIKDLGGLTSSSNIENIFSFLKSLEPVDYLIVSLDTIAYGGLVSSRRTNDSFEAIKKRIEKFFDIVSKKAKKIYAFSSVMRISNNNINEEEKRYWSKWGKRIFDWSYYLHKSEVEKTYNCVHNIIPGDILEDYLQTRKRNFEINRCYLSYAKQGLIDELIFSKDDCAEFGLNVKEANILKEESKDLKNVQIKTGADEIPLSLISKALVDNFGAVKIKTIFLEDKSKDLISKYEDISIKKCVEGQIKITGSKIDNNSDLDLIINNFKTEQGDLVLGDVINTFSKDITFPLKPYFIADVNNANGADTGLIEQILKNKTDDNFYGIACYNTSANTIGASIFIALNKYYALKNHSFDKQAFLKTQFIRLLDDWAYQALSRKYVRNAKPEYILALKEKEEELNQNAKKIENFLNYHPSNISYSLPWERSFEIRIILQDKSL